MVRYAHGYYWICPKCKSSYDVGRYFIDKKMKCVCGDIYVIKKWDGTVVMRDGDVELPANARYARDEETDLLSRALSYIKKYSDLFSDSNFGLIICEDGSGHFINCVGRVFQEVEDNDLSVFSFSNPTDMINKLNRIYSEELKKQRDGAITKLKEEIKKLGLKESDLF